MGIKLGDAGTMDHFGRAFQYKIKKRLKKKRMDESIRNLKILYKCTKAKYQCYMAAYAAHTTNLSDNGGLGKNRSGEWAKSRKG